MEEEEEEEEDNNETEMETEMEKRNEGAVPSHHSPTSAAAAAATDAAAAAAAEAAVAAAVAAAAKAEEAIFGDVCAICQGNHRATDKAHHYRGQRGTASPEVVADPRTSNVPPAQRTRPPDLTSGARWCQRLEYASALDAPLEDKAIDASPPEQLERASSAPPSYDDPSPLRAKLARAKRVTPRRVTAPRSLQLQMPASLVPANRDKGPPEHRRTRLWQARLVHWR